MTQLFEGEYFVANGTILLNKILKCQKILHKILFECTLQLGNAELKLKKKTTSTDVLLCIYLHTHFGNHIL